MKKILALMAILMPAAASANGFDREMFERWVSARAGTGEPVYWYSEGDVKSYPDGKKLVRMEGFDAARLYWSDKSKPEAIQLSRKIYVFRDIATGEILREFNGKPVEVVKFPYQYITYKLDGDKLITWVEQGAGKTYLKIGPGQDTTVRRLGRSIAFTSPLYLDVKGAAARTLFENYDFFIHPDAKDPKEQFQLSWLRYGNRGGFSDGPTITHMISWRVDKFADLPAGMREFVEKEAPLWLKPPADRAEIERLQKQ
jgi:hypothetical protein